MSRECVFCGNVTGWRDVGAMIVLGGAPNRPQAGLICRRCTALPLDEQARRREAAIARAGYKNAT
jgi:hypothetical protein